MGKRLIVQKRGAGGPVYRAAGHKRVEPIKYRKISHEELNGKFTGKVIEMRHEPGRTSPIARVLFYDGQYKYILPAEGVSINSVLEYGSEAEIKPGNVLPLSEMPVRTPIFNIELRSGDGGKLVRSAGGSAIVESHSEKWITIELPSGKTKKIVPKARATVGIAAGGGVTKKPFLKAGARFYQKRGKGHKYPRVRGTAMNPVNHPFGGGSHQSPSKPTTVSRNAPPGRKVGLIAARRTGRRKGRSAKRDV